MPALDLTLENDWPAKEIIVHKCREALPSICGVGTAARKRFRWLQIFLSHIVGTEVMLPKELVVRDSRKYAMDDEEHEDGDMHRISKDDLERLYSVAVRNVRDELLFLMLLTTGMRIGGFVQMKIRNVADVINGKWQARMRGQTIEKGHKVFHFELTVRVRELLGDWLNKHRAFDPCEYVFPGRHGTHLSTQRFRQRFAAMCKDAKLEGKQFHLHALRHCYSHILLELGNSPDVVSKLLNHTNPATTQKFYLKESMQEVTKRAVIPWLSRDTEACTDPVPAFLVRDNGAHGLMRATAISNARAILNSLQGFHVE